MTRDILIYALDCGCTDWCTCGQCGLTEPHQPGTSWCCDQHGPVTVTQYLQVPDMSLPVENGELIVTGGYATFALAADHPMRAARCGICSLPIGGELVTVIAIAGLGGPGCHCGLIPSSSYLIHGTHLTMPPEQMLSSLETAMTCETDHPWTN